MVDIAPEISFNLTNGGVGPAKLVAMQFTYKGKPMLSPREFLKRHPVKMINPPDDRILKNVNYPGDVNC